MSEPAGLGVAVVSGAGSGIGAAAAEALAARGHALALVGRRLETLAATLARSGARGLAIAADVRDGEALRAAAARIERELGAVTVVVPAAGIARVAPLLDLGAEGLRDSLETNLLGVANLVAAHLPDMVRRGRGWIVPIHSVASRRVFPGWSAYCASKWGLLGWVETLREELQGTGVRLCALTPGATESPLWDGVPGQWNRQAMIPAAEVARALIWALETGDGVDVVEIRMQPPGGNL